MNKSCLPPHLAFSPPSGLHVNSHECVLEKMWDIPSVKLSMRMFIHAWAEFQSSLRLSSVTTLFIAQASGYLLRAQLWPGEETETEMHFSKESARGFIVWREGEKGGGGEGRNGEGKASPAFFWAYSISCWLWLEPRAWKSVCSLPVVVNVIECSCWAFLHRALCLSKVQCKCMFG